MTNPKPVNITVIGLAAIGFFAVCTIGVVSIVGCGSPHHSIVDRRYLHHSGAAATWVLAQSSLNNILEVDSSIATRMFDHPYVYITAEPGASDPVPPGWRSVPTVNFKSYADFSAAVTGGTMPSWTKAVLYDPEAWSKTPYKEQMNVAYYMQQFCRLAHSQGWLAVMTPGTDLMNVYRKTPGETNAQAFVRHNIAGGAARYADVSVTQSQSMETSPRAYNWFLTMTRSQALAANPKDVFLGGLTANLLGTTASSEVMYHAAVSVTNAVAGFSLNTSKNAPDPMNAARFLHKLAAYQQGAGDAISASPIGISRQLRHRAHTARPAAHTGLAVNLAGHASASPGRRGGVLMAFTPISR